MIEDAVQALVQARRTGHRLVALPAAAIPADLAEAHAVQDATVAALGDAVAGWKVAISPQGEVMRGVILRSRLLESPAALPARDVPLLGIEGEIAFRFDRDLPRREAPYTQEEIAAAVTALVGIEIVDTRFESYRDTPPLHRAADCMSNGAFVTGTSRPDWRDHDLAQLEATVRINGTVQVQQRGGHAARDPLRPAIPLVNALGKVSAGQIITTGTYTGLIFAKPGDRVVVEFTDFGTAEIHLTA